MSVMCSVPDGFEQHTASYSGGMLQKNERAKKMEVQINIREKLGDFSLAVDFTANSKRIGILGASGCGKSMTLKNFAGIETPDSGVIRMDDKILFDSRKHINLKPQQRNIGYLFQNYALFPTMTVEQNIAAGLKCEWSRQREIVADMIRKFRLSGLEKRLPGQLSGGQQQRVALARIMAYGPDAILLDEPFSALDIFLKDRLQQELFEMLEDYEGLVIMVSHSRDEIYRFSEELMIMDQGSIVVNGATQDIFDSPKKMVAARLTGCKNFSNAIRKDAHTVSAVDWGIDIHTEQEIPTGTDCIGYRAHDFTPVWGDRQKNCIKVQVKSIAKLPFEINYYLKSENPDSEEEICWFLQREVISEIEEKGTPDYVKFEEKKLLFLQK